MTLHAYPAHSSMFSDWKLSLKAALTLIRVNLQQQLTYRDEIWSSFLQMFVEVIIFRQLWIALYQGREMVAGVTLEQAVTYSIVNIIVARLFSSWLIVDVNDKIRNGDIILDIARPMGLGRLLCYKTIGGALTTLLTASLPAALVLHLLFKLALPASPMIWGAFAVSLILGFFTSFLIDYLVALSAFWLTEVGGFYWSKSSIIAVLGGTYFPLWLYPPALMRILEWLPFRGISYTPLAIFVGQIGLDQVPQVFGFQIAWLIALIWLSSRVYAAAVKKLAVQGG